MRTTPEATDLHALFAVALRARRRRRGHGGVQPRAGLRPGRRRRASTSARSPTSASTISTSTPTSTTTSRPRRGSSTGAAGSRCSTATTRRCAGWSGPGRVTFSAAGRPEATWRAEEVDARRASASASPRIGPGRRRRCRPGWRCPAGTTSPTRCSPSPAWSAVGVDPATAAAGHRRPARGVPGRLERVTRPARCSASSTTPTSRTRSSPRWPRCASVGDAAG